MKHLFTRTALAAALAATAFAAQAKDDITVAMQLEPPHLDPTSAAAQAIDSVLYTNVFEGLTRFMGDGSVVAGLAESWEISDDGTVYTFRLREGEFKIFPQPPPAGLDIHFEYQSKNWVDQGGTPGDKVLAGTDVVLFDRTLITRYLKLKWLESKGFDTTKPQDDFNVAFNFITGKDKGGEVLSMGRGGKAFPYLDTYRNTRDGGYGLG